MLEANVSKHPVIEQLIDAQLNFLKHELSHDQNIQSEIQNFSVWFQQQQLGQLWSLTQIQQLAQQQVLDTPASDNLIAQIAEHIRFALVHPSNDSTTLEQLLPVNTIDRIAQYVSSKTEHRQKIIQKMVNNPAFNKLLTQLIQNAIQDYLDNGLLAKKVPGVGRFMKMGKSVLESVTDSNLDDTIGHYLNKNIRKISQMSEQLLNQYFDNERLYQLQANVWHKVKVLPVGVVRQYVVVDDLDQIVRLGQDIWEHLRQTDYLKQQVQDGIAVWYARNQELSMQAIMRDLNIDDALIAGALGQIIAAVIQPFVQSDALYASARQYLEKFYYASDTRAILNM